MSRKGKWDYFKAIYERYRKADRRSKQVIFNEFCLNTGYHRKRSQVRVLAEEPILFFLPASGDWTAYVSSAVLLCLD